MPDLPPEIFESILNELDEVDDLRTLTACSLAGSILRYPSQKILFRTFVIDNGLIRSNRYAAARLLLQGAPHIASYVKLLRVRESVLEWTSPDPESLRQVLFTLVNLTQCKFAGEKLHTTGGLAVPPMTWSMVATRASPLFEFLRRQTLQLLRVRFIENVPLNVFFELLTAAPTVAFREVSVQGMPDDTSPLSPPHPLGLQRLMIDSDCETIIPILLHPRLLPYTAAVRFLSVETDILISDRLILNCADSLEHLRFNGFGESTVLTAPRPHKALTQGTIRPPASSPASPTCAPWSSSAAQDISASPRPPSPPHSPPSSTPP